MAEDARTEPTKPISPRELLKPLYKISAAALAIVALGGAFAVTISHARFVGLVVVWLVSGVAGGAFLGLLFGVPKRNKTAVGPADGSTAPAPGTALGPAPLGYGGNSNFEDISDWLTKVIVGATLVGLQGALSSVWRLAKGMVPFGNNDPAAAAGASLVVGAAGTGMVAGFICMYLWTRNELPRLLNRAEQPSDPDDDNRTVSHPRKDLQGTKVQGGEKTSTGTSTFRPIGEAAWTGAMTGMTPSEIWEADFNKGKFGGSNRTATRLLSAELGKITDNYVEVMLTVKSTDPLKDPLKGRVAFYLHPTFTVPIIYVDAADSCAQTDICAADAFVVGVECDDGRTVLELDLAKIQGFPGLRGGTVPATKEDAGDSAQPPAAVSAPETAAVGAEGCDATEVAADSAKVATEAVEGTQARAEPTDAPQAATVAAAKAQDQTKPAVSKEEGEKKEERSE